MLPEEIVANTNRRPRNQYGVYCGVPQFVIIHRSILAYMTFDAAFDMESDDEDLYDNDNLKDLDLKNKVYEMFKGIWASDDKEPIVDDRFVHAILAMITPGAIHVRLDDYGCGYGEY